MRIRLVDEYPNWYWNSGTGVTIKKDNREGVEADIDNPQVQLALEQGILEIIPENEESKIITDTPSEPTLKEIVTEDNTKEMKRIKQKAKKGAEDAD